MGLRIIGLLSITGLLAAGGCAAIEQTNAAALPQRKFIKMPYGDDTVRYVWADAKYCKCIYAGTEAAYGRYWKLAMDSAIATDRAEAAVASELYGDSGAWGPWGPWW